MKRIVILDPISEDAARRLANETGWAVEQRLGLSASELPDNVRDADVLIVRSATKLTAEVLAAAKRLKVIGRAGIGVDNIDMDAASEREIRVINTPGATTTSVAEITVGAMLSLARWMHVGHASMKAGEWRRGEFPGLELKGKLIGIIGFGRIGREVARLAQAFGMRVTATDPYLGADKVQGVKLEELDGLLARADFVSLHVPLEDDTRNLIGQEQLEKMKRGAFLLNFGRGGLVDEDALADLLDRGHLAGCALDTYATEPPADSVQRLREHTRSLLLPHVGSQTREGQIRVGMELVDGVAKAIKRFMTDRAARIAEEKEEAEAAAEAAVEAAALESAAAAEAGTEPAAQPAAGPPGATPEGGGGDDPATP